MRLHVVRFLSLPNKLKILPSFPAVFSKLLDFLNSLNVRRHSQCGVEGFSEPYIFLADEVVVNFPTSLLNVVKDIDDSDIIKPCGLVLYFDDERQWDGLFELVFDDGIGGFVGSKSVSSLIVFRFVLWYCDVVNGRPDGYVIDTWIEGNDVVNAGEHKVFRIGHS